MNYYFWRIRVRKTLPPTALWFFFIAFNTHILGEPLNKKFKFYAVLYGKLVIYLTEDNWGDKDYYGY